MKSRKFKKKNKINENERKNINTKKVYKKHLPEDVKMKTNKNEQTKKISKKLYFLRLSKYHELSA